MNFFSANIDYEDALNVLHSPSLTAVESLAHEPPHGQGADCCVPLTYHVLVPLVMSLPFQKHSTAFGKPEVLFNGLQRLQMACAYLTSRDYYEAQWHSTGGGKPLSFPGFSTLFL